MEHYIFKLTMASKENTKIDWHYLYFNNSCKRNATDPKDTIRKILAKVLIIVEETLNKQNIDLPALHDMSKEKKLEKDLFDNKIKEMVKAKKAAILLEEDKTQKRTIPPENKSATPIIPKLQLPTHSSIDEMNFSPDLLLKSLSVNSLPRSSSADSTSYPSLFEPPSEVRNRSQSIEAKPPASHTNLCSPRPKVLPLSSITPTTERLLSSPRKK
jgi:hypothetical protein